MPPRVSAKRTAEINGARLNSPGGVRVVRAAAKAPHLWTLVHPEVKNALILLEAMAGVLDRTLDDVLANVEQHGVAKVRTMLEIGLEDHHRRLIGLRAVEADRSAKAARARRGRQQQADARVEAWRREIDARPSRQPKHRAIGAIADREGLSPEAVEKAMRRYEKRTKRK